MQNTLKFDQKSTKKSTKNRPKIDQKSTKNGPKIGLGGALGALGGQDRKKTKKDTNFWGLMAILGPSWGPLGAVLALGSPSWAVLGRLKSEKNRCKNRSKKRCILESIFGRILVDFGRQNGGMLAPESIKNRCQLGRAIF